jgi:hypothetical protein
MSCSSCKGSNVNTINGINDVNGDKKFNYFSRILTFVIGFILAPVILIGIYYLMFKHIIIKGQMTIDINSVVKYYTDWKKQKNEDEDEEFDEELDPDDYELITKVDKVN